MSRRRIVTATEAAQARGAEARPPAPGVLVFAYGSNLRGEQMTARCPSSEVIEKGRLRGFALAFVGFSRRWGGGVATVVRDRNESVAGVVYRVSEADLVRLDAFEGAPYVYRRTLRAIAGHKGPVQAWVYEHTRPEAGAPSYRYFAAIVEGRARHGFDAEPVIVAAEAAAAEATDLPPF